MLRHRRFANEPQEPPPPEPGDLVARRAFEASPENKIVVAESLEKPHKFVAATRKFLRRPRYRDDWGNSLPESLAILDIAVSEGVRLRALCIMDALAKALATRGMNLRVDQEGRLASAVSLGRGGIPLAA